MMQTNQLTIRACRHEDIPTVVQLVQWAYRGGKTGQGQWTGEEHLVRGPRTTPEKLAALIEAVDSVVLLCERTVEGSDANAIVGCIHCDKKGVDGHVAMLAVDPGEQAGGIGRALMEAAEEHARTRYGAARMVGEVISGRPELMAWYERLGYKATGETAPFVGPEEGVTPLVEGLHFIMIRKELS
jgi:ribosomal protein S18 acetylase RimI-like enzyme